ncbi:protein ALTERED PHOSPHATE STARVATION RESPONSE 1-like [Zingiber officinale]|uniref:protein ALTERED PHOSPHATE STARVATION RESPONSE 1-like n=1 Tax=Zingiber officinale TaxID=94328 RepID=UPI001C4AF6D1|nr:protein ALTERED PHOSPHATE STARVATION RESPONSE 1-like [Zingiber officinale]XP_042448541.1 protein ALTERED PHOSPHATE STARVATION RESPONSE 1-like [Zingiber officinale]
MGCTYSTVEVDEVLGRCKERRRLMKQLMKCRADLAAALISYLQSLRNTGATLRQLTEVGSVISGGSTPVGPSLQPSPQPPASLPPSPPPPNFLRVAPKESTKTKFYVEDSSDMDDDDDELLPPPPPPFPISGWDFGEHMGSTPSSDSSSPMRSGGAGAAAPEDDWAEPKSEFGGEEVVEEVEEDDFIQRKEALMNRARETDPSKELVDDNMSTVSKFTKVTEPTATVSRSKETWAGIAKELDEYFLKAAAGGKDVTVLLESNQSYLQPGDSGAKKGKSFKSAKVVHVLSWSWSFRSSHSNRDSQDVNNSSMSATHCTTLEKILSEEQKLYNQVKDEENIKSQHKKILLVLDKLQGGDYDWSKTERTLSDVEELQCRIISLKESINETCLSISKLRDEELFPQLVAFCDGLVKMWRTMHECHQEQDRVSQHANHLDNSLGNDPTTDSRHHAISQLEAEVTSWYTTFSNLFRCQREYIRILNQWVKMTDCLPETNNLTGSTSNIHDFCDKVQGVLDRLPDKAAAEAINSFLLVLRSIIRQHTEEHNLQKRSDRLKSRLDKEMVSFQTLEKDNQHAKLEALKKKAEEEKVKYLHSIRTSRTMMLDHLQTGLPNVFQTLMGFSSTCVQALNNITSPMGVIASFP